MFGKIPCFKDALNIVINGLAIKFAASFTRFVGGSPGQGASIVCKYFIGSSPGLIYS